LTAQDSQLGFSHVQPTAVLRGVVDLRRFRMPGLWGGSFTARLACGCSGCLTQRPWLHLAAYIHEFAAA
jgi:hypothetical protein